MFLYLIDPNSYTVERNICLACNLSITGHVWCSYSYDRERIHSMTLDVWAMLFVLSWSDTKLHVKQSARRDHLFSPSYSL